MKIGKNGPLLWAIAAATIALGFFLSFPSPSLSGQSREISVQTQHRASEDALLTGRTAATNQLTPGDVLDLNSATQAELEGLDGIVFEVPDGAVDHKSFYYAPNFDPFAHQV